MPDAAAFDCDVIVAGGGPAGSAASAWLARHGRSVKLFERDSFPRFHIGESLLASVNDALVAIGADDLVRRASFPEKWGATFMLADGRAERYADFGIAPGVRTPQTWQVPRAAFDNLLLRHAASTGVEVHERHRIVDVAFDAGGVTATVTTTEGDRHSAAIRARAIIDASGRGGLLSRKFGLRIDEPRLANIAVFSHYSGVPRQTGRRSGDIRIVSRGDLGWFWLIPISGDLMSVGVVLPRAAFQAKALPDHESLLERAVAETPVVAALLSGCPAGVAGPCREGLFVQLASVCRRSLAARRRCRFVPRSRVFDWRGHRTRVRCRGGAGCGGGARGGRPVRPALPAVRSAPAVAVPAPSGGSCWASTPRNSVIFSSARTHRRTSFARS